MNLAKHTIRRPVILAVCALVLAAAAFGVTSRSDAMHDCTYPPTPGEIGTAQCSPNHQAAPTVSAPSAREAASGALAQICGPEVGNRIAYWLGSTFEGLPADVGARTCQPEDPVNPALGANNHISFIYGSCVAPADGPDGVESRCLPPLEIQTAPYAERNRTRYTLDGASYPYAGVALANPHLAGTIKESVSYDGGTIIEIYVDNLTISVFGNDAAQARRAADAVRRIPKTKIIPPPAKEVLTDAGLCPVRPAPWCEAEVPDTPKPPVQSPVDVSPPSVAPLVDGILRMTVDPIRSEVVATAAGICGDTRTPKPVRDAACAIRAAIQTSPRAVVADVFEAIDQAADAICGDGNVPPAVNDLGCQIRGD